MPDTLDVREVDHHLRVAIPNAREKAVTDLIGATSQLLIAGVPPTARLYFEAARAEDGGRDRIVAVHAEWTTPPEPLPGRLATAAGSLRWRTRAALDAVLVHPWIRRG